MSGYKSQIVEWAQDEYDISVECLLEEWPGYEAEWIPDMATLEVSGEYPVAGSDQWNYIKSKAYDIANQ